MIRKLQTKDLPQLSNLYQQFWNEESNLAMMKQTFDNLKSNNLYMLLGFFENDTLLGSVMGIVCYELYGDCFPFLVLENMIVDKNHRKKGIGKILIKELEKQAKEKGCKQIILVTEANRIDACAFYEAVGFHPTANKGYKKKL